MSAAINWVHREQDLGSSLNTALHTSEPSRFRFLLASLSPHAPDWQDPPENEPEAPWVAPFSVGVQRPLYATERDWQRQPTRAAQHSFMDWFLKDCLDPEAFAGSEAEVKVPGDVQANMPHWLLARATGNQGAKLQESDLVDLLDKVHATA